MNAVATLAGFAVASCLERPPRGKTPLIVHRPPVHDALRRLGVEPLFTR